MSTSLYKRSWTHLSPTHSQEGGSCTCQRPAAQRRIQRDDCTYRSRDILRWRWQCSTLSSIPHVALVTSVPTLIVPVLVVPTNMRFGQIPRLHRRCDLHLGWGGRISRRPPIGMAPLRCLRHAVIDSRRRTWDG